LHLLLLAGLPAHYQAPFTMTLGWQRNRHADAGRHPRLSLP
jgi:hypothetical protein